MYWIVWHVCITCVYGIFISIPWSPIPIRSGIDLVFMYCMACLYYMYVWHVCITCMYGIFISIPWSPIPVRSWSSWSWPVKPVWIGKRTGHRHQLWLFTPTSKHVQPSPENRKDNVHGSSIFGGQVVSVLAFYSDDQSSDPRWNLRLFL